MGFIQNQWASTIHRWLFPPHCLLCGERGSADLDLCHNCHHNLPRNDHCCSRCATPLLGIANGEVTCGRCIKSPPAFDKAFAPFRYNHPIDHLLHGFKYNGQLAMGRTLGQLMVASVQARDVPRPEALMPIPLHREALAERGFNQATQLAEALGQSLGIPVLYDICERQRATQRQSRLNAETRQRNIKNAFNVVNAPKQQHIAIVDDVITTGVTANEVARTLKAAGVQQVTIWSLCRAGR